MGAAVNRLDEVLKESQVCFRCRGDGSVMAYSNDENGLIPLGEETCSTCGGDGRINVRKRKDKRERDQ